MSEPEARLRQALTDAFDGDPVDVAESTLSIGARHGKVWVVAGDYAPGSFEFRTVTVIAAVTPGGDLPTLRRRVIDAINAADPFYVVGDSSEYNTPPLPGEKHAQWPADFVRLEVETGELR
ncbi:MAG: hypothetical protein OXF27_07555 [Acidobacteria bacterium]|nr:hypothetical protein [Acidobacteriota bacterium]